MNIQTDRALIPAGSTAERFLAITITAPTREAKTERPAVNVALVLDRSGSMAGGKIEMARKAVEHAVRLLNERDRIALVCARRGIVWVVGQRPSEWAKVTPKTRQTLWLRATLPDA